MHQIEGSFHHVRHLTTTMVLIPLFLLGCSSDDPVAASARSSPPSAIEDLRIGSYDPPEVLLEWQVAPADRDEISSDWRLEARMGDSPLQLDQDWEKATPVYSGPLNGPVRDQHLRIPAILTSNLSACRTSFIAIRVENAAGTQSPISNSVPLEGSPEFLFDWEVDPPATVSGRGVTLDEHGNVFVWTGASIRQYGGGGSPINELDLSHVLDLNIHDLEVRNEIAYIASSDHGTTFAIDLQGNVLYRNRAPFSSSHRAVAVTSRGEVFRGYQFSSRIDRLSSDGGVEASWSWDNQEGVVMDIAAAESDIFCLVRNDDGRRLWRFGREGARLEDLPVPAFDVRGRPFSPQWLAMTRSGDFLVADPRAIVQIGSDGSTTRIWPGYCNGSVNDPDLCDGTSGFDDIRGLAVNRQGTVYLYRRPIFVQTQHHGVMSVYHVCSVTGDR